MFIKEWLQVPQSKSEDEKWGLERGRQRLHQAVFLVLNTAPPGSPVGRYQSHSNRRGMKPDAYTLWWPGLSQNSARAHTPPSLVWGVDLCSMGLRTLSTLYNLTLSKAGAVPRTQHTRLRRRVIVPFFPFLCSVPGPRWLAGAHPHEDRKLL